MSLGALSTTFGAVPMSLGVPPWPLGVLPVTLDPMSMSMWSTPAPMSKGSSPPGHGDLKSTGSTPHEHRDPKSKGSTPHGQGGPMSMWSTPLIYVMYNTLVLLNLPAMSQIVQYATTFWLKVQPMAQWLKHCPEPGHSGAAVGVCCDRYEGMSECSSWSSAAAWLI